MGLAVCRGVGLRSLRLPFRHTIPCAPEILIFTREEGGDEIVFGAEMAVQARLCNARLLDHTVDADSPHALTIDELRGGLEDTVPHLGRAGRIGGIWALHTVRP